MKNVWMMLAVAGGGAAGALARWGLSAAAHRWFGLGFPWGTLAANAVGCLAAGVLFVLIVEQQSHPLLRLALMVGFLGALTTFSTFGLETVNLLTERRYAPAAANVLVSVMLGLVAVAVGMWIARRFAAAG